MTASQTSPGLWDDWDVLTVRKTRAGTGFGGERPKRHLRARLRIISILSLLILFGTRTDVFILSRARK